MPTAVGDKARHRFVIDTAAMEAFRDYTGDDSLVHTDEAFARSRGFERVIVYGGLMLAHLSSVLGCLLPGRYGTSLKWSINYRRPLYVGEEAELSCEVTHVAPSVGVLEMSFRIVAGERVIATGSTQSIVPLDELAEGLQDNEPGTSSHPGRPAMDSVQPRGRGR